MRSEVTAILSHMNFRNDTLTVIKDSLVDAQRANDLQQRILEQRIVDEIRSLLQNEFGSIDTRLRKLMEWLMDTGTQSSITNENSTSIHSMHTIIARTQELMPTLVKTAHDLARKSITLLKAEAANTDPEQTSALIENLDRLITEATSKYDEIIRVMTTLSIAAKQGATVNEKESTHTSIEITNEKIVNILRKHGFNADGTNQKISDKSVSAGTGPATTPVSASTSFAVQRIDGKTDTTTTTSTSTASSSSASSPSSDYHTVKSEVGAPQAVDSPDTTTTTIDLRKMSPKNASDAVEELRSESDKQSNIEKEARMLRNILTLSTTVSSCQSTFHEIKENSIKLAIEKQQQTLINLLPDNLISNLSSGMSKLSSTVDEIMKYVRGPDHETKEGEEERCPTGNDLYAQLFIILSEKGEIKKTIDNCKQIDKLPGVLKYLCTLRGIDSIFSYNDKSDNDESALPAENVPPLISESAILWSMYNCSSIRKNKVLKDRIHKEAQTCRNQEQLSLFPRLLNDNSRLKVRNDDLRTRAKKDGKTISVLNQTISGMTQKISGLNQTITQLNTTQDIASSNAVRRGHLEALFAAAEIQLKPKFSAAVISCIFIAFNLLFDKLDNENGSYREKDLKQIINIFTYQHLASATLKNAGITEFVEFLFNTFNDEKKLTLSYREYTTFPNIFLYFIYCRVQRKLKASDVVSEEELTVKLKYYPKQLKVAKKEICKLFPYHNKDLGNLPGLDRNVAGLKLP